MNFGNKLKILIEEYDITQKDLAAKLNIAPSTLSSYVQNTREPDFKTLKMIANYFNVSTDYLLDMPDKRYNRLMEDELIRVFRLMTEEQKEMFIEQGKVFAKSNKRHREKTKSS